MTTKTEQDDRLRKKKKKKKPGAGLWIGLGIGGGVLLLAVVVGVVLAVWRPWERGEENKPAAQNPPLQQQPLPGKLGGEVVKEPKSLLGNIRRRADEIARDAEMDGIVRLHFMYCEDFKNPNTRSLDSFLKFIKTEPSKTVNAIKTNEYKLNLRARVGSDDIVVYEGEPYTDGYFCMRADKSKGYVSAQDLKTSLGQ